MEEPRMIQYLDELCEDVKKLCKKNSAYITGETEMLVLANAILDGTVKDINTIACAIITSCQKTQAKIDSINKGE